MGPVNHSSSVLIEWDCDSLVFSIETVPIYILTSNIKLFLLPFILDNSFYLFKIVTIPVAMR